MALLDYITECYKTKKEVNKTISTTKLNLVVLTACRKRSPTGDLFLVKQGEIWYNKYG